MHPLQKLLIERIDNYGGLGRFLDCSRTLKNRVTDERHKAVFDHIIMYYRLLYKLPYVNVLRDIEGQEEMMVMMKQMFKQLQSEYLEYPEMYLEILDLKLGYIRKVKRLAG